MAAVLVPAPTYPLPGQRCSISFTGLAIGTTKIQLNATNAPDGSAIKGRINAARGEVVNEYSGKSSEPWLFTPDIGGVYTFDLIELQETPASGIQFAGDTSSAPNPTITQQGTVVLYVGEKMTLKLGENPHQCDLIVHVWNDTVRRTTIELHGIESPKLDSPKSPAAASAVYDATLLGLVDALVDVTVATILGTFSADFTAVHTAYNAHVGDNVVHNNADTDNDLETAWNAYNSKSAAASINELRRRLGVHIGTKTLLDGTTTTHDSIEGTSVFQSSGATDSRASQYFALADAYLRLEAHKVLGAPVHNSSDTDPAASVGPLTEICIQYITALQASSPTLPPARNSGAARLEQFGGFTK